MTISRSLSVAVLVLCLNLAGICLASEQANKIPDIFKQCPRENPDKCFRTTLDHLRPYLAKGGIPELNIPDIEPMRINQLVATRGSGPVMVHMTLNNMIIHGLSNYTVLFTKTDVNTPTLEFALHFPQIFVTSQYDISGRVLILPINGDGNCWIKINNLSVRNLSKGKRVQRSDGKHYIHIDSVQMSYDVGNVRLRLENLFNGDMILGETMNTFLNENWRDILDGARGSLIGSFSKIFKEVTQSALNVIPVEALITGEEKSQIVTS